jgi:hypothetical protein
MQVSSTGWNLINTTHFCPTHAQVLKEAGVSIRMDHPNVIATVSSEQLRSA